jgi:hypothetical protein
MIKKTAVLIICLIFTVSNVHAKLCNQKFDFSDYSATNAAIRSAILPGWGQGWNEQEKKGWIFRVYLMARPAAFYFNNEAEKVQVIFGNRSAAVRSTIITRKFIRQEFRHCSRFFATWIYRL